MIPPTNNVTETNNLTSLAKINSLTVEERAWLAGLSQAEGYFHFDNRVRAKTPGYIPAPPRPQFKIEMVELDLMTRVGELLGQNVIHVARKTTANNQVYKVNLTGRAEVEAFLLAIQPYVVGVKTGDKIKAMLAVCEEYKAWEVAGGKQAAARIANKASQKQKKQKSE